MPFKIKKIDFTMKNVKVKQIIQGKNTISSPPYGMSYPK